MTSDEKIMLLTGRIECLEKHIIALARTLMADESSDSPRTAVRAQFSAIGDTPHSNDQNLQAGFLQTLNNIQNEA